ncbi:MAG: glycosyltransferase family 2 protein [Pontibacterium sp.]
MPTISLIITTYNWPLALDRVLASVMDQEVPCQQVVIADDGSTGDTKVCIEQWRSDFEAKGVELTHVWQPDEGFRASAIRNKAAAAATGEYLVYIDGDCVIRPRFIAQHQRLAKQGWFVAGNRVLLSKAYSHEVITHGLAPHKLSVKECYKVEINRPRSLKELPLGPLRYANPKRWKGVKTCNLGVWKQDLERVNGFDESFVGWGYEDSEFAIRLLRAGVKCASGKFATTVMHLWHNEHDRSGHDENYARLMESMNSDHIRAHQGLDQYL